jgi:hypothetical protein
VGKRSHVVVSLTTAVGVAAVATMLTVSPIRRSPD